MPTQVMTSLNLNELRGILAEEIENLRAGKTSAATVNAIVNASGKILSSVKLQMEYYRLTGRKLNIPLMIDGEDNGAGPEKGKK